MAIHNLVFYNIDPLGVFNTAISGTATYAGPATAGGAATINDSDGVLEDFASETATADVSVAGSTSTGANVYAEEIWSVRDTITGEEFQIATLRVDSGGATGYYTLSEQPLIVGRSYETVSYDTVPDQAAGDAVFSYSDYAGPLDGVVEGTSGDDIINTGYTGDTEGDRIDNLDNIAAEQASSVHSWANQGIADETDIAGGISGTTDGIQVDVSVVQEANFTAAEMETTDNLYNYNGASDTSSLMLFGGSAGTSQDASTVTFDFSATDITLQNEVIDVQFGIFDLDEFAGQFLDQVTITAFDANGNPVPVTLTPGNASTISVVGDTATAISGSGGGGATTSQTGFLEVTIQGPVAQIVIDYNNVDPAFGNHAIRVGDLTFNAVTIGDNEDIVNAGDGNDYIDAGIASDTMSGEAGNDTIIAGVGDDTLYGGADADRFQLDDGFGNDSIAGGEASNDQDVIDAANLTSGVAVTLTGDEAGTITDGISTGTFSEIENFVLADNDDTFDGSAAFTQGVTVDAGIGNDSILGTGASDTIIGGAGDDTLDGGAGSDALYGGLGADSLGFNVGDTATGGDGDDIFTLDALAGGPAAITITGGEGNETAGDTLNLMGQINSSADIIYSGGNNEAGTATLIDGSVITFSEIESVVICFAKGTHIMTDRGDRMVQNLELGDMIITRDNGLQKIRWIGSRKVPAKGNLAPIVLPKGIVNNTRDLVVSPQHRMLITGLQTELLFGQSEVLVPAKHLLGNDGIYQAVDGFVEYFHILFDAHEIIFAEGAATESYHPGDYSLGELGEPARDELFKLFPYLRSTPNSYGPTARTCLKGYEGKMLDIAA